MAQPIQKRTDSLLHQIADHYQPPSEDIGDPEKYYWPKAMARMAIYGDKDTGANRIIARFAGHPPFHFTLVGMARLMHAFPHAPALVANRHKILEGVFARTDSYNAFTGEGTENHVAMSRTSGYLVAQAAIASGDTSLKAIANRRLAEMRAWIIAWSDKATRLGTGEWNSGVYEVYNLLGWLNLADYAQDTTIKKAAQKVVQYYAAEMALHYSYGVLGGAEMRGTPIGHGANTASSFWGWYWFGNDGHWPNFLVSGEYIQSVHAVLSAYKPAPQLLELAAKKNTEALLVHGSKPDYTIQHGDKIDQTFFADDGITLGSAKTPFGGWTGTTAQVIPWKAVIRNPKGFLPAEISGNGGYYQHKTCAGKDPYTQVAQDGNVLVQLTCVPADYAAVQKTIRAMVDNWASAWQKDYLMRFPGSESKKHKNVVKRNGPVAGKNVSYISLPQNAKISRAGRWYVVEVYGKTLGLYPIGQHQSIASQVSHNKQSIAKRAIVTDSMPLGGYCGWVVVAGIEAKPNQSISSALEQNYSIATQAGADRYSVAINHVNKEVITVTYQDTGSYTEPLVDWGYGQTQEAAMVESPPLRGPDWPTAMHGGRMPKVMIGDKPSPKMDGWIYAGNGVKIGHGQVVFNADARDNSTGQ